MRFLALALLVLALAVPDAGAQTLYGIEGTAPGIGQFVGGPDTVCGYPTGPLLQVFAASQPFPPCPPLTPFAPPAGGSLGDIATDHDDDKIWATDGVHFARYTAAGVIDAQFILATGLIFPTAVTGLGCNSNTGRLWVTDGVSAASIGPGVSCTSPTVFAGPFLLAGIVGLAQDIEFDPCTGTLWVVTSAGHLSNHFIGGALISDALVTPGPCGLAANLTGLGIDTTDNNFFVTDGSIVARIGAAGGAAPTTFYFPSTCQTVFPALGGPAPLSGLAFSLRPIRYGKSCDPVGGAPFPRIGSVEQFCSPNAAGFAITLSDATPFSDAYLFIGATAACPPAPLNANCNLYLGAPAVIGPIALGAAGSFTVPVAVGGLPCFDPSIGSSLYLQWIIDRPPVGVFAGGIEVSEGLSMRLGLN